MMAADEVFLASTTAEAVPVVRIDGRKIASGKPGEITNKLREEIYSAREAKGRRGS
jgi:branched-subunit amino acid aminotransferase/4-amino-4-deoxychorismate lyase